MDISLVNQTHILTNIPHLYVKVDMIVWVANTQLKHNPITVNIA